MKFIFFLCLNLLLLSSPAIAERILSKSEVLEKSNKCLIDSQNQECKKLIMQMEQIQIVEFNKNRFKCQTSILGLQTEIIEAYFFNNIQKSRSKIMIPYVIKNC